MPIYIHPCNLIIRKSTIVEKYKGGIEQFRSHYSIGISEANQEDDELLAIGKMNVEDFDIEKLIGNGISFDEPNQFSNDFCILYRSGDFAWKTDWITHNMLYAWDIHTSLECIKKVEKFSENTMEDITEMFEAGENPFVVIRK